MGSFLVEIEEVLYILLQNQLLDILQMLYENLITVQAKSEQIHDCDNCKKIFWVCTQLKIFEDFFWISIQNKSQVSKNLLNFYNVIIFFSEKLKYFSEFENNKILKNSKKCDIFNILFDIS